MTPEARAILEVRMERLRADPEHQRLMAWQRAFGEWMRATRGTPAWSDPPVPFDEWTDGCPA